MKDHVLDPVHRARNELKHDRQFRDMVSKAKEAGGKCCNRKERTS